MRDLSDIHSLDDLAGGALLELFHAEWEKVLENIADPNTSAEAQRSLSIKLTIKPGEDRDTGRIAINVGSKLAPAAGTKTQVYFVREKGRLVALEHNPKQLQLELDEDSKPRSIEGGRGDE